MLICFLTGSSEGGENAAVMNGHWDSNSFVIVHFFALDTRVGDSFLPVVSHLC